MTVRSAGLAGSLAPGVESVAGAIPAEAIGATLVDEHVLQGLQGSAYWRAGNGGRDAALAQAAETFAALRTAGVSTIVDTTTIETGRDGETLRAVADSAGIAIVCSTGLEAEADGVSAAFRRLTATMLADVLIAELEQGIPGTDVRPGVITVASGAEITPFDRTALLAAAFAHAETGAPVLARAPGGAAVELVQSLLARGVDPERILARGLDGAATTWAVVDEVARKGVGLGFTGIGRDDLDQRARAALVAYAVKRYGAGRVFLGTGACAFPLEPAAHPDERDSPGYAALAGFLELLREFGVSAEETQAVLAGETLSSRPSELQHEELPHEELPHG